MDKWRKETPMMARNRSLHERLLSYAPPHHFPAYIATTIERDESGAYLKIPLISPLAAAFKHQACKYCGSFEVGSSHLPCRCSRSHISSRWHKFCTNHTFPLSVLQRRCATKSAITGSSTTRNDSIQKTRTCLPATLVIVSLFAYQSR